MTRQAGPSRLRLKKTTLIEFYVNIYVNKKTAVESVKYEIRVSIPDYVGTAGGPADGVSLPRNNWKLKNASMPKMMDAMKQVTYIQENRT